jgi:hypothetical protein
MLASGLHRFTLAFALLCVGGWLYVLSEWWGPLAGLLLCAPVGVVFSLIPPAVVGTIRPIFGDVLTTWASIAIGLLLATYAFAALEGAAFALVGLGAAAVFFGGASLFYIRFNAVRRRIATGG